MDLSTKLSTNMDDIVKVFDTRMSEYEDKLQKASASACSGSPDISSLACDFSNFKNFVWRTLSMLKTQMELLTLGVDRHETFMRRKVLLFHGLPESKEETLPSVICTVLSDKLKLSDVSTKDLEVCHRLGSNSVKPRPVLVRFYNAQYRKNVWDNKACLKDSGITISEFLTKVRHQTFMAARKHFGVRHCWTSDGKIHILLPNKTRCIIETMSELERLLDQYPIQSAIGEDSVRKLVSQPKSKEVTPKSKSSVKSPKKSRRAK